jgi:hypothetical protein
VSKIGFGCVVGVGHAISSSHNVGICRGLGGHL